MKDNGLPTIYDYKKYLVVGYLEVYNPSVYGNKEPFKYGPLIVEVWAYDVLSAEAEWFKKVAKPGQYYKGYIDVEVREL